MLAAQREATYARRARVLRADAASLREDSLELSQQVAQQILSANLRDGSVDAAAAEKAATKLRQFFPNIGVGAAELSGAGCEARVAAAVAAAFEAKCAELDAVRARSHTRHRSCRAARWALTRRR